MTVNAVTLEDILRLMATDLESDEAFFKLDSISTDRIERQTDDSPASTRLYIGPFPLYE